MLNQKANVYDDKNYTIAISQENCSITPTAVKSHEDTAMDL